MGPEGGHGAGRHGRIRQGALRQDRDADRAIVDRVGEVAAARSLPRAQVALAWLLNKPAVAPIVCATKPHHLEDAVAVLAIELSPEEISRLEEPYTPHPVLGFS